MKKIVLQNIIASSLFLALLVGTNTLLSYKKPIVPDQFTTLTPEFVKIISFGNYRFLSSFIWAKTLLDADTDHIKKGEVSWLSYRFNLISELDPTFYENYLHGGVYLSIIKDDIYSAAKLFEKGMKFYPNDFKLTYNAAFNYHFQIKDFNRSLKLYEKIQLMPQKYHFRILPSLIQQAKDRISVTDTHLKILYEQLDQTRDNLERRAIRAKIEKIKKGQQ